MFGLIPTMGFKGYRCTNLCINGDFGDGTTGWEGINATIDVVDGKLVITPTGTSEIPRVRYNNQQLKNGHMYYLRYELEVLDRDLIDEVAIYRGGTRTILTKEEILSGNNVYSAVIPYIADYASIYLYFIHPSTTGITEQVVKLVNVLFIDISDTFGSGNEPDVEYMDDMMIDTLWFDGDLIFGDSKKVFESTVENNVSIKEMPNFADILFGNRIPKPVAHRGYTDVAPDNSMPAYEEAITAGFWAIECDIYRTSDGVWVMCHDATVDATTDGTGTIADMTYAEIQALNIDVGTNIGSYPNLKIPTLEDTLKLCRENGMIPLVDLKYDSYIYEVVNMIRDLGLEGRTIIQTNEETSARTIRSLSEKIPIIVIVPGETPTSATVTGCINLAKELRSGGINIVDTAMTEEIITECHRAGVYATVFNGIIEQADADTLIGYGIDAIISNNLVWSWK